MAASQFQIDEDDERTIVSLSGEIDLGVKEELAEILAPLHGHIVVDLANVTFLDSAAIGVLAVAHRRVASSDGDLRSRGPNELIRRTLTIVGFADWIDP